MKIIIIVINKTGGEIIQNFSTFICTKTISDLSGIFSCQIRQVFLF